MAQDCGNRHQHHAELTGVLPLPLINLLTLCECLSPSKLQFLTRSKGTDAVGAVETTGGHTPRAHVHINTCSCGRGAHPGPAPGPMSSLAPIMHLSALRLLCCGGSREVPLGFRIVSKNCQSLCGCFSTSAVGAFLEPGPCVPQHQQAVRRTSLRPTLHRAVGLPGPCVRWVSSTWDPGCFQEVDHSGDRLSLQQILYNDYSKVYKVRRSQWVPGAQGRDPMSRTSLSARLVFDQVISRGH